MTNNCELFGEDAEILSPREANWTLKRVVRFLKRQESLPLAKTDSNIKRAGNHVEQAMLCIQDMIDEQEADRPICIDSDEPSIDCNCPRCLEHFDQLDDPSLYASDE